MKETITNNIVNHVEKVFNLINQSNYEAAYIYLLEHTATTMYDPLIKEWVKSLCEYYVYEKQEDAIQLLEIIKPTHISSDMDFRIYLTLLKFTSDNPYKTKFLHYVSIVKSNLQKVDNQLLKIQALYSISQGYYNFKIYEKAIKYAEYCIDESVISTFITTEYALSIAIRVKSFTHMNLHKNAELDMDLYNDYKYLLGDGAEDLGNDSNSYIKEANGFYQTCMSTFKKIISA